MLRLLYKVSKKTHKLIGLFIIFFLIWSSISGIILNHKELFSPFNVPSFMVPEQYSHNNWNRGSMINFLFLKKNPDIGFVGGKRGVFKTTDGGKSFKPFNEGYPTSLLLKKTNHLILIEENNKNILFAGNNKGLYFCDISDEKWQRINFSKNNVDVVLKIIKTNDKLIILTDSEVYTANTENISKLNFSPMNINRLDNKEMSLIDYFRHIHSGNVWGLFGRLLFDILGLIIIFLSVSAFYIWYFPKNLVLFRKTIKKKTDPKYFKVFLKYHKSIGVYTAVFLLLIAITAFFMRPPFVAVIADAKISNSLYPSFKNPKPWDQKIHNGVYLEKENKIILETTEGFYEGALKKGTLLKKFSIPLKVFVMGATVFERLEDGFLIGSFNGIYKVSEDGIITDYTTKAKPEIVSSIIPGKYMITGSFITPDKEEFITTHRKGILYLSGKSAEKRFPMPEELIKDNSMSLWNYMFEIHNGRFFKDLIGKLYILIIPFFSLFLFIVTVSGVIDWLILKYKGNKNK